MANFYAKTTYGVYQDTYDQVKKASTKFKINFFSEGPLTPDGNCSFDAKSLNGGQGVGWYELNLRDQLTKGESRKAGVSLREYVEKAKKIS